MGGVGKYKKQNEKLVELCTNFEELGGTWENRQILSPKIVVWGGEYLKIGWQIFKKTELGGPYN